MNKIFKIVGRVSMIVATGIVIGSCTSNPDSAGLEYMPDMYRSPAIEPYVDYGELRGRLNPDVSLKQSALTPPSNTIPFYGTDKAEVMLMLPYHRLASPAFASTHGLFGWEFTKNTEPDYEYNQAAMDKNPLLLTAANSDAMFKTGKELFAAQCMHCHGEKGDGNGPMVVSGAYSGVPNYADRVSLGDGQMFYSIYYGKGAMGSHASLLNKKEIWTLVHYIRKFQNADYGKFNADGTAALVVAASDTTKAKPAVPVK
ncbi:MAG: c-type cytochrome [Flavobacteriia bacterium]|jgi:mono/diheme cytochrome c family protein